ncbi:MAG: hypothetical protein GEU90_05150 [Gemmatimonas sp.]|nr:hypothetical protein [Gemmatimonas sp.]
MVEGLLYTDEDGREWTVTLEAPGKVLSVPSSLERSGALLPEHELRIVFRSGGETYSEAYTSLSALEDLSDDEIQGWLETAIAGAGL